MLLNLHVKNLALIEEADINFDEGLNILTGETGAGKSILLGSVSLALGAKTPKEMIGKHGDYALVELLFSVDDRIADIINDEYDIEVSDNQVLIFRKITDSKNVMKVNGQLVTLGTLRSITALLMDVHGQHEHQSLLHPENHLAILDKYSKDEISAIKSQIADEYRNYKELKSKLSDFDMDEKERLRNIDFLEYEINEIEQADIKSNEDVELEARYKKINNSQKLVELLGNAHELLSADEGASSLVGRAYRDIETAGNMEDDLSDIVSQIADIDGLIYDLSRELSSYIDSLDFDEAEFTTLENRLDLINGLKAKHGGSIEAIDKELSDKKQKLDELIDYDNRKKSIENALDSSYKVLIELSDKLTDLRMKNAKALTDKIMAELLELNFLSVNFLIDFKKLDKPSDNGMDYVEFLISVNPGEEPKSLSKVASGGELSRIMLAIKTVLADKDEVDTLIFDEIDAGISGRTAQMVAKKLHIIGKSRQVLCITHLPQIAAMADSHFEILKEVENNLTVTRVSKLDENGSIMELARLLGGDIITDAVIDNAKELKKAALAE